MGQGMLTGLALCTGHSYSKATPVYESFAMDSIKWNRVAGRSVTRYYGSLIKAEGKIKEQGGDQWPLTLEDMKEKMLEIPLAGKATPEKSYKMPDGKEVKLGSPNYKAADIMFDPSLLTEGDEVDGLYDEKLLQGGEVIKGLHELVNAAIRSSDCDMFELLDKIVLYGGNSMIKGLPQEFERRMKEELYPKKQDCIGVRAPDDRVYAAVQGGAVITGSS